MAEFIGSPKINILPLERSGAGLHLYGTSLNWPVTDDAPEISRLGLRPEALCLTKTAPRLTGRVAHFENLGSEVFAQIALNDDATCVTQRATPAERQILGLGTKVELG